MSYTHKEFIVSATQPTDTTKSWIDTSVDVMGCSPLRYYIGGQWTNTDNAGEWYDFIGNIISHGAPYKIIVSGQSNPGGCYFDGWLGAGADPPYNGYRGDMNCSKLVSGWDDTLGQWVLAATGVEPFQYCSGANYTMLLGKKIAEDLNRSVRVVVHLHGGTTLNYWTGDDDVAVGSAVDYLALASKITNSGMTHPDVFVWGQGEAGYIGANTYYDRFTDLMNKLILDRYLDDTTYLLASGTGDPAYGGAIQNGSGGTGDGGLRAIGANNNRYWAYVDVVGVETDGIHFTCLGHEELGRRMFAKLKQMPLDPTIHMLGYETLAPFKLLGDEQKISAGGITFANSLGDTFLTLRAGADQQSSYGDAGENVNHEKGAGLFFNPMASNTVVLKHYNGTGFFLDGTNVVFPLEDIVLSNGYALRMYLGKIFTYDPGGAPAMYFQANYNTGETQMFLTTSGLSIKKGGGAAASAALEIGGTTQGFLPPRMTKAQRDAISSPATGLMIFQTDNTPGIRTYNGTNWIKYTETTD